MVTSLWIFVILSFKIISEASPASAAPTLEVNRRIQALSDDVSVEVSNAQIGAVVELFHHNQPKAINAQIIVKKSQVLVFNCGYFFKTGSYNFRLKSPAGDYLPLRRTIVARDYPKISLEWQEEPRTLSTDVKVNIRGKLCDSHIARQNRLALELHELKQNGTRQTDTRRNSFPITPATNNFLPLHFVLPCSTFNVAGQYRVDLVATSPHGDDVTLSKSDVIDVEWSSDYNLRLEKSSFPCTGLGVTVTLTTPACPSQLDEIRLLSVSDGTMTTVATKVKGLENHVTFPCRVFRNINTTVQGLCFQYVTETGHVTRTICEAIGSDLDFKMAGSWSSWTEWATCRRPCRKPTLRKKRVCDNPAPQGKGELCERHDGRRDEEELVAAEVDRMPDDCQSSVVSSQFDKKCSCGCAITIQNQGQIVSSLDNDCLNTMTSIWIVNAPAGKAIKFVLKDDQLAHDEYLTVRDGDASFHMTSHFPSVTSRSNISIVQLVKSRERNNLNSCGFMLDLKVVDAPATLATDTTYPTSDEADTDLFGWIQNIFTDNPVVVGGIGACVVIILVVVIIAVAHRRRKEKSKIPPGLRTPMNYRMAMPPDGRSCSNAEDTESEPMVRPRPVGTSDNADVTTETAASTQPAVGASTAYYLAQRQLEIMKRLGKNQHTQSYATGFLSEDAIRQQEELLFGDRKSLHKNEDLRVT